MDSRAILMLNILKVTLVGAFRIWLIKPTNTNIANQTNNLSNKTVHISFCLSITLTTEKLAYKYIRRYLQIMNLALGL